MLAEQQPAARFQDAPHLAERGANIGDAAGRIGEDDGVGAAALEGQRLCPALIELDRQVTAEPAVADAVEHREVRIDADHQLDPVLS